MSIFGSMMFYGPRYRYHRIPTSSRSTVQEQEFSNQLLAADMSRLAGQRIPFNQQMPWPLLKRPLLLLVMFPLDPIAVKAEDQLFILI